MYNIVNTVNDTVLPTLKLLRDCILIVLNT